jgi:UDP:flavonoid glycosyltransferase YjiC (YdhE family)
MNPPQKVLLAPMDWGLGHATRMMPVIDALLAAGQEVLLAGSGESIKLLKLQYPQLPQLPLPGYRVSYPSGSGILWHLMRQIPRLLGVIRQEHRQLQAWIEEHKIDRVISDNRYGLWSPKVPCHFVCHQLAPLPKPAWKCLHLLVYRLHRLWLKRFDEIWVPDHASSPNLAGILAHRFRPPAQTRFLGPLSRFEYLDTPAEQFSLPELNAELPTVAIVLSGPEPQRSFLAEKLRTQAKKLAVKIWLILGKTERQQIVQEGNLTLINYLEAADLHRLLLSAQTVVSRPGYSSIMDYAALGLPRVILIPTPGQTEQEYLAQNLAAQNIALCRTQQKFDLEEALEQMGQCAGFGGFGDNKGQFEKQFADILTSWQ